MAKGTQTRTRPPNASRAATELGNAGAEIVMSAARLLDEEMALGLTTAKAVQKRLQEEKRVEPADFEEALTRLRANVRDIVKALEGQFEGARLQENGDLARRFVARTNDLLDVTIAFAATGAELAGELVRAKAGKKGEQNPSKP